METDIPTEKEASEYFEHDPEYEHPELLRSRKRKLEEEEEELKEQTKKKIKQVLKVNFDKEVISKDSELERIDSMLIDTRSVLDRLRACVVTKYYTSPELMVNDEGLMCIHPSARKHLQKQRTGYVKSSKQMSEIFGEASTSEGSRIEPVRETALFESTNNTDLFDGGERTVEAAEGRSRQFHTNKLKVVVGNVSRFIPVSERGDNESMSHIWKAYVRESKDSLKLSEVIEKVCFLLHQSFAPNDFVEIRSLPYEITRRGWGDFPLRVRLHFKDNLSRPIDIVHHIRLDRTYTGLTTLNSETHAEIKLAIREERFPIEEIPVLQQDSSSVVDEADSHNSLNSDGINNFDVSEEAVFSPEKNMYLLQALKGNIHASASNAKFTETASQDEIADATAHAKNNIGNSHENISSVNRTVLPCSKTSFISPDINSNTLKQVPGKVSDTVSLINKLKEPENKKLGYILCSANNQKTLNLKSECIQKAGSVVGLPKSGNFLPGNNVISLLSKQQKISPVSLNKQNTAKQPLYVLKVSSLSDGSSKVLLLSSPDKNKGNPDLSQKIIHANGIKLSRADPVKLNFDLKDRMIEKKKIHITSWKQLLQTVDFTECKTFENLLKKLVKIFPIINQNIDRSLLPFCFSSMQQYTSSNIGKIRAAEWQHAVMLRKAALHIIEIGKNRFLKSEDLWTKRRIMMWCKKYGHTPDIFHATSQRDKDSGKCLQELNENYIHETSYSDISAFISSLKNISLSSKDDAEIIDIVEPVEDEKQDVSGHHSSPQSTSSVCVTHISDSAAITFVRETAANIKIRLKPIELETGIKVPVVEEMILSACKSFTEDVLRSALCKSYEQMGQKRSVSSDVTLMDVYSVLRENTDFSFLTNKHLSVLKPCADDS